MFPVFYKAPLAVRPFGVDWGSWLKSGETIIASSWTVDAGLTQPPAQPPYYTDTTAVVWISGGTVGQTYVITNEIRTSGGSTDTRSLRIEVVERP